MSIHAGHRRVQLIIVLVECGPNLILPLCANAVCWQLLTERCYVGKKGQRSLLTI